MIQIRTQGPDSLAADGSHAGETCMIEYVNGRHPKITVACWIMPRAKSQD